MATSKLPDTPHGLLRLALKDLKAVMESDRYVVDMSEWMHQLYPGAPCEVCLAGATMAMTLKVRLPIRVDIDLSWDLHPVAVSELGCITKQDAHKLVSLDAARRGDWWAFFSPFDDDTGTMAEHMSFNFGMPPAFHEGPDAFFEFFDRAADALEEFWPENVAKEQSDDNKA